MGNCCSGDDSKPEGRSEAPIEADDRELYGPAGEHPRTSSDTPFLVTPDTMAVESEMENNLLLQKQFSSHLFNPRLVSLLEFFSHLYVRKKDLFTRVISLHEQELLEVLTKVEQQVEERPRIQPIQRSRSIGTGEQLRNDWMKVKTFEPDKGQPPGGGPGQGGTAGGGAKPGGTSK